MLGLIALAMICRVTFFSPTVFAAFDKPNYNVDNAENLYRDFTNEHNKTYDQKEYTERLVIFKETLKDINERNLQFPNTVFAVNHFADLKPEELKHYFGFKLPNTTITEGDHEGLNITDGLTPRALDWREKNAVSPIKNQGPCKASYIFSAVGNIEGQYAIKYGQCLAFSEGQALDCLDYGSCDGYVADMASLMRELAREKKKLERAKVYPYTPRKRRCRETVSEGIVQVASVKEMILISELRLKVKLSLYGPLSIALDGRDFLFYKKGILEPKVCSAGLNLALLLVGYGEENGKKFWIVKNSWGTGWGEEGYARVARGVRACGIGTYIALSTVQ